MKKRLLSMLLVLVMVIGLLPTAAMAVDANPPIVGTGSDANVDVTKSALPNGDGTYDITITVTPKTEGVAKPLELVLLLDVSGSMAWCTQEDHEHDEDCEIELSCAKEAHRHTYECGTWEVSCELEEHRHTKDLCYQLVCTKNHKYHNSSCYELVCDKQEHRHSMGCYTGEIKLTCGKEEHSHTASCYTYSCGKHEHWYGGVACAGVEAGKPSRLASAVAAASSLVNTLVTKGLSAKVSIVTFSGSATTELSKQAVTNAETAKIVTDKLGTLKANGGTYMEPGVKLAANQFSNDPDTHKVLVMLADGDNQSNDDETIKAAKGMKDAGVDIYTIAFTKGIDIMQDLRANGGTYSVAGDETALNGIFAAIANDMTAKLTDSMGSYVDLVGTVTAGSGSGTASVSGDNTITWQLATLKKDVPQTISYKVAVDVNALNVGANTIPLNGSVGLTYKLGKDEKTVSVTPPQDTVYVGRLTEKIFVDDIEISAVQGEKVLITGSETFTWDTPAATYNGATYVKTKYDGAVMTATSKSATSGDHVVAHYYSSGYTLTYDVNGGNPDGPKQVSNLSAQNNYPLSTTKPTHDPVDGVRVVFIGWTEEKDTKIYAKNETAPTCITKVDIVGNTTVYAVYGYDTNGDNIPDVLQNWYTLTYDGNGATVGTVPAAPATYLTGSTVPVLGNTGNLDMTTGEGASLHNYVFAGWNTAADGTGTTYQAGDTFQIKANTILYAMWELDDWNDTEDKTTGGDNIPDKYQAVVVYKSADENQGTVSLAQEVVTIQDDTYPIPATVGRLKITGSTATPKTGYVFENWTSALTFTGAKAATLAKQTIHNVEGGKTYTFTAHFDTAVPGLNITKTLKSVGGVEVASTTAAPMAKVGDEIVWIITVNNSGNCDLSKIPVKDVLKDEKGNELTGVSVRPIGTYGNYGDELGTSWTIETLPVGQTSEYIVTYKVTAADAGKTLTNSAVSGETTGNAPGVTVETSGLTVTKTVNTTTAKVGDKLTYTITVTNTGNTTLYRIELTDAMLNVTETIDALRPGVSWTESYEYTVKTADAGKTIVNTAVAKASDGTTGSGSSEGTKVQSTQIHVPTLNKKDHVAYIIGYEDNTVRPENNITRAEVATIFFRLLTDDSRARFWSQTNDFSDVSANDWFNNAVSTMANAGVLTGYPDGTFKPNAPITRAEFAAIAARFSDVTYNGKCSFTDVAATYWAADEIALAEHLGWITGYPDDTFRPGRNITRAEAMTLINRVLERDVEEEHMLKNMVKWIDNSPNAWYYEAVQEATNSHTYTRLSKKVPGQSFYYEDWVAILENPDWAALERAWSKANDQ